MSIEAEKGMCRHDARAVCWCVMMPCVSVFVCRQETVRGNFNRSRLRSGSGPRFSALGMTNAGLGRALSRRAATLISWFQRAISVAGTALPISWSKAQFPKGLSSIIFAEIGCALILRISTQSAMTKIWRGV